MRRKQLRARPRGPVESAARRAEKLILTSGQVTWADSSAFSLIMEYIKTHMADALKSFVGKPYASREVFVEVVKAMDYIQLTCSLEEE